jgi:hypothetical protein
MTFVTVSFICVGISGCRPGARIIHSWSQEWLKLATHLLFGMNALTVPEASQHYVIDLNRKLWLNRG